LGAGFLTSADRGAASMFKMRDPATKAWTVLQAYVRDADLF